MVFEPNFTKVVSSNRKTIGTTQSVIEVKLPTNESDITAIYSINAKSTIISAEPSGNDVNLVGSVDFQVVYESLGVASIDYSAEFRDKLSVNNEVSGEIIVSSNVIDTTSSIVSGGIRVVAIVETTVDEISSKDVNVLTSIQGESAFVLNKDMVVTSYLGKASDKIDVSGDFELKDATKVLLVSPSVCLDTVTPKDNYISINGTINLDICYATGINNNDIMSHTHVLDFSGEVAFDGVLENSSVQSNIQIMSNEIKVSTTLEESGAQINVYIPVMYNGYIFNSKTISVIDDVYSRTHYLSTTRENFDTIHELSSINFKDTVSGSADILETAPFIDEILCVMTNNIVVATSRVDDGVLAVEGIANASVEYYTKETESITSVMVEMPFSIEQRINGEDASIVSICLTNINARSKRGKEIEVSADLSVFADVYSEQSQIVISNVVVGDEKPQDECALFIYIVKPNQTLWDIAKEMNISQETLLEQNPDVQLPLKAGDKLVVYTPRVIEYL